MHNAIVVDLFESEHDLSDYDLGMPLRQPIYSVGLEVAKKVTTTSKFGHYKSLIVEAKLLYEGKYILLGLAGVHSLPFTHIVLDVERLVFLFWNGFYGDAATWKFVYAHPDGVARVLTHRPFNLVLVKGTGKSLGCEHCLDYRLARLTRIKKDYPNFVPLENIKIGWVPIKLLFCLLASMFGRTIIILEAHLL